ncbi:MAG: hypothetical protein IM631_12440 [Cytophagales bacterium]|nr:hypothetical protein [Cytophagales bacterium]MCA6382323.1 hypothetical protein [Cytophagales bacterium]
MEKIKRLTQAEMRASITEDMVEAANTFCLAKALVQTVRPVVEGYQKEILALNRFTNKGEVARIAEGAAKRGREPIQIDEAVVLDPEYVFLLSDEDFKSFWAQCLERQKAAGLVTKSDEECPLLVAESTERQARRLFVDAMKPITKMDSDMLMASKNGFENFCKAAELSLHLLGGFGLLRNVLTENNKSPIEI